MLQKIVVINDEPKNIKTLEVEECNKSDFEKFIDRTVKKQDESLEDWAIRISKELT